MLEVCNHGHVSKFVRRKTRYSPELGTGGLEEDRRPL